ncbi:hypothetical protein HDV00_006371 [Rhizophlyctis rosea]|nr:hypothetical protein HDV00_006371 [Rhizophlyctis rosea]
MLKVLAHWEMQTDSDLKQYRDTRLRYYELALKMNQSSAIYPLVLKTNLRRFEITPTSMSLLDEGEESVIDPIMHEEPSQPAESTAPPANSQDDFHSHFVHTCAVLLRRAFLLEEQHHLVFVHKFLSAPYPDTPITKDMIYDSLRTGFPLPNDISPGTETNALNAALLAFSAELSIPWIQSKILAQPTPIPQEILNTALILAAADTRYHHTFIQPMIIPHDPIPPATAGRIERYELGTRSHSETHEDIEDEDSDLAQLRAAVGVDPPTMANFRRLIRELVQKGADVNMCLPWVLQRQDKQLVRELCRDRPVVGRDALWIVCFWFCDGENIGVTGLQVPLRVIVGDRHFDMVRFLVEECGADPSDGFLAAWHDKDLGMLKFLAELGGRMGQHAAWMVWKLMVGIRHVVQNAHRILEWVFEQWGKEVEEGLQNESAQQRFWEAVQNGLERSVRKMKAGVAEDADRIGMGIFTDEEGELPWYQRMAALRAVLTCAQTHNHTLNITIPMHIISTYWQTTKKTWLASQSTAASRHTAHRNRRNPHAPPPSIDTSFQISPEAKSLASLLAEFGGDITWMADLERYTSYNDAPREERRLERQAEELGRAIGGEVRGGWDDPDENDVDGRREFGFIKHRRIWRDFELRDD